MRGLQEFEFIDLHVLRIPMRGYEFVPFQVQIQALTSYESP